MIKDQILNKTNINTLKKKLTTPKEGKKKKDYLEKNL